MQSATDSVKSLLLQSPIGLQRTVHDCDCNLLPNFTAGPELLACVFLWCRLAPLPTNKAKTVKQVMSEGLAFLDEGR